MADFSTANNERTISLKSIRSDGSSAVFPTPLSNYYYTTNEHDSRVPYANHVQVENSDHDFILKFYYKKTSKDSGKYVGEVIIPKAVAEELIVKLDEVQ
jgi:hypothetical protein